MLHYIDWYTLTRCCTPADLHVYSTKDSSLIHILTDCVLLSWDLIFRQERDIYFSLYALNGVRMELPSS